MEAENSLCPPGTRKMGESEKKEMLSELNKTKY